MPILSSSTGPHPHLPSTAAGKKSRWPAASAPDRPGLRDEEKPPALLAGLDVELDRRALTCIASTLRLMDEAVQELRTILHEEVSPVALWSPAHTGANAEYWWEPSSSGRTAGLRKVAGLANDLVDLEKQLRRPVADLAAVTDLVNGLHQAATHQS